MKANRHGSNLKVSYAWARLVALLLSLCTGFLGSKAAVAPPLAVKTPGSIARIGTLEVPLINYMVQVGSNAPISALIVLKAQFSNDMKRQLYRSLYLTNSTNMLLTQRQALIQQLQQFATQQQSNLLYYLSSQPTNIVQNVRPLWVANVIGVQATASVLINLATSNTVDHIHLDLPRKVLQSCPSGAWNLTKIGVNPMAAAPTNEQPVVVAVLDTGVDDTEPDLQGQIWSIPSPSGDLNGHGTEIAGIIAGNGTNGVRTGVSPNARLMVLRESDNRDRSTEQECWSGIQFAYQNQASILNFSSGWRETDQPDSAAWRSTIENVSDHMLFVTAAGNWGDVDPVPLSVTVPGRVPLALTVGASDSADGIPLFSGQGPVTWINVPPYADYPLAPGLNKPDLAAPGLGICTLQLMSQGGGYNPIDGTSMAAPQVSGVAALLLGQNPMLTPYTVRFLLEENAVHINGMVVPEPQAGWGRVEADTALTNAPDLLTPYDLTIDQIRTNSPPVANQPMPIFARWVNMGGQVLGNSEVRFFFTDAQNREPADLEPSSTGMPDPNKFTYIGSYFVPIIGPTNSLHATNEAVVLWTPPATKQDHWWLGAWILPGPASPPENNPHNNGFVFEIP
jgi:hypothetical protein